MAKVRDYIEQFTRNMYPALFDEECCRRIRQIGKQFGDRESNEVIEEVVLGNKDRTCDFSIKTDRQEGPVKNEWYEIDYDKSTEEGMVPCYFMDASGIRTGGYDESLLRMILSELTGKDTGWKYMTMLKQCISALDGKCKNLFQLGIMNGRNQQDQIRIFTDDLTVPHIIEYLSELNWQGDVKCLEQLLIKLEPYSDGNKFILDFDVTEGGISEKIGINFGTKRKDIKTIHQMLFFLEMEGLCLREKRYEILRWAAAYPSHTPFIQNDISHFKIPFQNNRPLMAKAYLRQSTDSYLEYRAFASPVLMNLELTTRCPLHCPQCYCDLNTGQELPFEKAVYWIRNAAENRVKTINLSGGETLCYGRLTELIALCAKKGMRANIAVSGCYFTKERFHKLVQAGIGDICVSLNGSTERINQITRDGYYQALQALQLLKEENFPDTCINWVMHGSNADDFEQMIALAERYHVRELVVMMFKPDVLHCLEDVPDSGQVKRIASIIKRYENPGLTLSVEECFSQMRAFVGERFLWNQNYGVGKGCGAGRDGLSVNVEGKLTPCRHLDYAEGFDDIASYWKNSEILKKLRLVEDRKEGDCVLCKYNQNCIPCMAVNDKLYGRIFMGGECAFSR